VLQVARASLSTAPAYQALFDELNRYGFRTGDNLIAEMRWVVEDARAATGSGRTCPIARRRIGRGRRRSESEAAVAATNTIPIVMGLGNYDPLARGYIKSLAQPGGKVTGISFQRPELAAKQADLLSQAFPDRSRLGILWDAGSADQFEAAESAARSLRKEVQGYKFERSPYDLDAAFRTAAESSIQMLLVESSPLLALYGWRIAELAIGYRLPTMFIVRSYVDRGGLMSYGPDRVEALRLTRHT
jgi:putative tryptophan/tyrosine transport system substrate-binding protein